MEILKKGSSGDEVEAWQNFLVGRGSYWLAVDGQFTFDTFQATKDFQKEAGLDQDGEVGSDTLTAAIKEGFPDLSAGPNWPPPPEFPSLSYLERAKIFGTFAFKPAGIPSNPEAIIITDGWDKKNIVTVNIPQLKGIKGCLNGNVSFHKLVAKQLQGLFQAWEDEDLLPLIKTFDGGWAARYVRGSRTNLSNHCLPATQTVWTTEGVANIADLKGFNGTVWSFVDGKAMPGKMSKFFNNGRKPLLKIYCRGHVIRCTPNHPILVMRKKSLSVSEWIPNSIGRGQTRAMYWTEMVLAENIRKGDRIVALKKLPDVTTSASLINLDWAEILGLFIGDGCIHHRKGTPEYISFLFPEGDRVRDHVFNLLTKFFGESPKKLEGSLVYYKERIWNNFLPYDKRARDKIIPPEIWSGSAAAQARFLLGYLYSDGTICEGASGSGDKHTARYRFKAGSKKLIEDCKLLVTGLGFRCERIFFNPPHSQVICGVNTVNNGDWLFGAVDVYGILNPASDPLYLERVSSASKPNQGDSRCMGYELVEPHFTHHIVNHIELDGEEDVYDIEVDGHHNFITDGIVVSNSYGSAFDLNYRWNMLGQVPALVDHEGSVRKLIPIANKHGFYSGAHFKRLDGMHFEIAGLM